MGSDGFISGLLQNLAANFIGWLVSLLVGLGVGYWGKAQSVWTWPTAAVIALVGLASSLIIYSHVFPFKWSTAWGNVKYEMINDQKFINKTIYVDGKYFSKCTFTNVTLVYKGEKQFSMDGNHFEGLITFRTTQQVALMSLILENLGFLKTNIGNGALRIEVEPLENL